MELSENLINTRNFPQPTEFTEKLNTLQEKFPSMLDDFEKYYVFYNKNPEFTEYQQSFDNIKNNLQTVFTELFIANQTLERATENINDEFSVISRKIEREKRQNMRLQRILDKLEGKQGASDERLNDFEDIYNFYYMRNFALLSGIIISGFVISKVFRVSK